MRAVRRSSGGKCVERLLAVANDLEFEPLTTDTDLESVDERWFVLDDEYSFTRH